MKKYSVKPKHIVHKIPVIDDGIEFDDRRRLRNALVALAALDPGWIVWIEQNISGGADLREQRQLVERQARTLTMKGYSVLGNSVIRAVIDSNFYFTDEGSLKAYS